MANVELRKIQVTGGSTHVVSLPKKWIDRTGLSRSDTLAIHEESDDSLLIVPHGDLRPKKRRVHIKLREDTQEGELTRQLIGAYLAGADEIHVAGTGRLDAKLRGTIRSTIRDLVGVEILEETGESVSMQDLVGASEMDLRKTVTRMHRIARIMFDDAIIAFETLDKDLAIDVTSRDDELDRLEWHVSKQMHALLEQPRLAARLDIRPAEALNYFLVARTLERMGDHASKLCKNVRQMSELPEDAHNSIMEQVARVRTVWDEGFTGLKRGDFAQSSKAVDLGKEGGTWRAAFSNTTNNLDPEIVAPLTLIADSVDRVRSYAIDISETALNHTFIGK